MSAVRRGHGERGPGSCGYSAVPARRPHLSKEAALDISGWMVLWSECLRLPTMHMKSGARYDSIMKRGFGGVLRS